MCYKCYRWSKHDYNNRCKYMREFEKNCADYWLKRNPIGFLKEYCKNHKLGSPHYELRLISENEKDEPEYVNSMNPRPKFVMLCSAYVRSHLPELNHAFQYGYGITKTMAKRECTAWVLSLITFFDPEFESIATECYKLASLKYSYDYCDFKNK